MGVNLQSWYREPGVGDCGHQDMLQQTGLPRALHMQKWQVFGGLIECAKDYASVRKVCGGRSEPGLAAIATSRRVVTPGNYMRGVGRSDSIAILFLRSRKCSSALIFTYSACYSQQEHVIAFRIGLS